MTEYDPIQDYWESYWFAIRIKRDRGDDYFVKSTDEDSCLHRSSLKSIPSLTNRDFSFIGSPEGNGGSFASGSVSGPIVGHEDFSGSLNRVHVDAVPADQDGNGGGEPRALHGGISS